MKDEKIAYLSACEMRTKIKNEELSSLEIFRVLINRIKEINPIINAYCTPTFEQAEEMAKTSDDKIKKDMEIGLLEGIPVSIKDVILTKNIRTTFGCKIYENHIPDKDEIIIQRIKKEGAVLLGKTNTPAFGFQPVTDNLIFGKTKNPWNLEKTPGGSSGGAAAQVVSGLGPLAIGSDGGGSIRLPSSLCGIFGLKPTFGRIPQYPHFGITWDTLDHYGPLVRYVEDAALLMDAIKGYYPFDKHSIHSEAESYLESLEQRPEKLKIGYSMDLGFIKALDPEIEHQVIKSSEKFKKLGWNVQPIKIKLRRAELCFNTLVTSGFAYDLNLKKYEDILDEDLVKMIRAGQTYSAKDVKRAEAQRKKIFESVTRLFQEIDILITPTTACTAFDLGLMYPPKINGRGVSPVGWMSFTFPFNLTGHPAATVPCGWSSDGLPIGMQIIGKRFNDLLVLQVSKAFQNLSPWQEKRPSL